MHKLVVKSKIYGQYSLVLSIVGIVAQAKGVLCESGSWSFHTAKAYITLFDFISITYVPL